MTSSARAVIAAAFLAGWARSPRAQDVVFRVDARLVEVHAAVRDGKKRYVTGLTRESFEVRDEGEVRTISHFESESARLACAVLLDTTDSMRAALPNVKNALARFIGDLREQDVVTVYAFSHYVRRLIEMTEDKEAAKRRVFETTAMGRTALFDAVTHVVADLEHDFGKRVILVFTDGDDNASVLNVEGAIQRSRAAGVPIYAVASGGALSDKDLLKRIRLLTDMTGGRFFELRKPKEASSILGEIIKDLRHTYLIGYVPPPARNGHRRAIDLRVRDLPKALIRARTQYVVE